METSFASSARISARRAAKQFVLSLPVAVTDRLASWMNDTAEGAAAARVPILPPYFFRARTLLKSAAITRRLLVMQKCVEEGRFDDAAHIYREVVGLQPTPSTGYQAGMQLAKSEQYSESFTNAALNAVQIPELRAMMLALMREPAQYHPSRLWLYFMVFNAFQIDTAGIEHFKRTVNNNYFNWVGDADIELQLKTLQTTLGLSDEAVDELERNVEAPLQLKPEDFSLAKWRMFARFLALLSEYAARTDVLGLLGRCVEPEIGSPLLVRYKGRVATQDLCNSVLDVNTIAEALDGGLSKTHHVAELGAGHGRIENVLLRARADLRVTIIDIPPALYVSQWYLSRLFPDKRVFHFREFADFNEVRAEFDAAQIAFLLPGQVELLPPKVFDGFINICSLQEMTPAQIKMWFSHIDRLCRGWFYSKQYKVSHNPFDNVTILRKDYPDPPNWSLLFDRQNRSNESMFEALYAVGGSSPAR